MKNRKEIPGSLVALFLTVGLGAQTAAADVDTFRRELGAVAAAMAKRDWDGALAQMDATLKKFADRDFVRYARSEIDMLVRRCRFQRTYQPPKLADLVSGKIVSYNEKTGRLKLQYTPNNVRGDFTVPRGTTRSVGLLMHGAVFKQFTMRIEGVSYRNVVAVVCANGSGAYRIECGTPATIYRSVSYAPSRIVRVNGGASPKAIASNDYGAGRLKPPKNASHEYFERWLKRASRSVKYPMSQGGQYKVQVGVTTNRIFVKINGRTAVTCNKPNQDHGLFGFMDAGFHSLTIEGKVDRSYFQNKLDEARAKKFAAFQSRYDPERHLPEWLFEKPEPSSNERSDEIVPGSIEGLDVAAFNTVQEEIDLDNNRWALFKLGMRKKRLPAVVTAWLRTQALVGLQQFEDAAKESQAVLDADGDFVPVRMLRGVIFDRLDRPEDAERELRAAVKLAPDESRPYEALTRFMIRRSRFDDVRTVLDSAAQRSVVSRGLYFCQVLTSKLQRGPNFAERFRVQTRHYDIVSDIDKKTCERAGRVLESAYEYYRQKFGLRRGDQESTKRFQVYLFSGRAGFEEYARGLSLRNVVHSAGLYHPVLQQLLIWNLANRTEMMRTVRHEGFHQFLDTLTQTAPRWFNEGLAEYFEYSKTETGAPTIGYVQGRHLRTLNLIRERSRIPLNRLLVMRPERFYKYSYVAYAQSWAFIHFLRHSTARYRKVWDGIQKAVLAGDSPQVILKDLAKKVDMQKLEKDYWAHVNKLRRKER